MDEENNVVPTIPQVVTPVVETESQLTAPLIDHATRVTRVEERQAQHQQEMLRQLEQLEERMATAASSQVESLRERIAGLEEKIAANAIVAEKIPDAVELTTLPDVAPSPEPPEKMRSGMRHRRKAKRGKK